MKLIIPSYQRPSVGEGRTWSLEPLTDAFDETVVLVHGADQEQLYLAALPSRCRVINTGEEPGNTGKARQMRWVVEQSGLVSPGEWFAFADDDIRRLRVLAEQHWSEDRFRIRTTDDWRKWQPYFDEILTDPDRLRRIFQEVIQKADADGARLCGFGPMRNSMYRPMKWRDVVYVNGTLTLWRAEPGFPWAVTVEMEDLAHTAAHLVRHGAVAVLNWVYPETTHFTKGGFGDMTGERLRGRKESLRILNEQYPGFFRYKKRKGKTEGSLDLAIKIRTREQLQAWSFQHRNQGSLF